MSKLALIMAVLASLVLSACSSEEHQDIKLWMNEVTKDMRGRVPPLPEIKPFPIVSYEAGELMDPFNSAKIEPDKKPESSGGGAKPDLNRFREPLESYPLDSLKMIGLIQKGRMINAIIMADKKVYTVKIGNYMGQNFGIITEITQSEIKLREQVQDASGDWVERASSLQLQEQEAQK
ncbi:MAG: pilus assembly protein PilP [Betaproteobacteria bacterium]|nr:pilus assembly protein PilP [Betaproteobacteria bacterium]